MQLLCVPFVKRVAPLMAGRAGVERDAALQQWVLFI